MRETRGKDHLCLDLELTLEGLLFGSCLESAVSELAGGIDEAEVGLFEVLSGCVCLERLAESENTLLDTWARTLDHDEAS